MRITTICLNFVFLLLTILAIIEHGWQTEPKAAFAFIALIFAFTLNMYFLLALKPAINIRGYVKPLNLFWLGGFCVLLSAGIFVWIFKKCSWGGCSDGSHQTAKLIANLNLTLMVVGLLLMIASLLLVFKKKHNAKKKINENT